MSINFKDLSYLITGSRKQREAYAAMKGLKVFEVLSGFSPVLTGTIPIKVDLPSSDLDIICKWQDKQQFTSTLTENYGSLPEFILRKTQKQGLVTIIAKFRYQPFVIEIFGQPLAVDQQMAYRHMVREYEILERNENSFRLEVIALKEQGMSTEAAFAKLLGIEGDPYLGLLKY